MTGRVVLAGGSGFIGRSLADFLVGQGRDVVVLTRSPKPGPVRETPWDGAALGDWVSELDGAEAVVNLAGRSVNCRYTEENKRKMIASRVDSVRAVGAAIRQCARPPRAWVQSGSLAIYGNPGDRVCDETSPPGEGFPVETCLRWEEAWNAADAPDTRKVLLRIGFALGRGGGALEPLERLARLFLGGAAGNGRQYISWLHEDDLNEMFRWSIEREDIAGVFNATGTNPVTNARFMEALRHALGRPWSPPAPAPLVRFGAWLMGSEANLALTGRRCVPARFTAAGFRFQHVGLEESLANLFPASREPASDARD
jgi:uncharacterized protein (TIGR01777 family)